MNSNSEWAYDTLIIFLILMPAMYLVSRLVRESVRKELINLYSNHNKGDT